MQTLAANPAGSAKPPLFEMRLAAILAAGFLTTGLHLPYFPVWLESIQLSASEIAVIMAAPTLVRLIAAPLILSWADRGGERGNFLIATSMGAAGAAALYLYADAFGTLLAITVLLSIGWAAQIPIAEAIALSGVRRFGSDYARIRVWGSISFLAANIAGGLIVQQFGTGSVPWMLFSVFVLALIASIAVPRIGRLKHPDGVKRPTLAATSRRSYMNAAFFAFIGAVAVAQSSHALIYTFGSIYWRSLGISDATIGLLWACGVVAEVAMFYAFRPLAVRVRPNRLLAAGAACAVLRWSIFPSVAASAYPTGAFFLLQLLHAFTFGLTFLAMQGMIAEEVEDEDMGRAQGVYVVLGNAIMAIAIYASGTLYERLGASGYYVMAAIALAGFALALALPDARRTLSQPQSAGSGGETIDPS